jgi:RsiW-degrading membrane proteinase PrsW (M82 family)
MEKVFLISTIVTILFCLVKFAEMKFIEKEMKPLKFLVRDAFIVMLCSFVTVFLIFNMDKNISEFFNVVTDNKTINPSTTEIFTDEPGF